MSYVLHAAKTASLRVIISGWVLLSLLSIYYHYDYVAFSFLFLFLCSFIMMPQYFCLRIHFFSIFLACRIPHSRSCEFFKALNRKVTSFYSNWKGETLRFDAKWISQDLECGIMQVTKVEKCYIWNTDRTHYSFCISSLWISEERGQKICHPSKQVRYSFD